ncbi:MAG: hypothetical protein ACREIS_01380 [Nitrospiraceae bacterium]
MPKTRKVRKRGMNRPASKRQAAARSTRLTGRGPARHSHRQAPSRQAKKRVLERIQHDTQEIGLGSLKPTLRKQGYEELPLEEIQDRLSKMKTALAEFIVSRRG